MDFRSHSLPFTQRIEQTAGLQWGLLMTPHESQRSQGACPTRIAHHSALRYETAPNEWMDMGISSHHPHAILLEAPLAEIKRKADMLSLILPPDWSPTYFHA
jgi:hypothetical protein